MQELSSQSEDFLTPKFLLLKIYRLSPIYVDPTFKYHISFRRKMHKLFDTVENVKIQIQKKRRKNTQGGPWSNMFGGNQQKHGGNQGWGQQGGNNNGWGQQQQGGNNGWGNDGWGQQGSNNGWDQQGGNNNGWGNEGNQLEQVNMSLFNNKRLWGNHVKGFDWVKEQLKRQAYRIVNFRPEEKKPFNLSEFGQFVEQQIIFLEPSPAEKRLEQLKKQGKTFYDDRFPPNETSLTGEWGHVNEWKTISWKKVSESMPGAEIFKGKVEPGDIKQGYLGDCYFLAGLAALAERPDRIFNLFLLQKVNDVKFYQVKMLYKGKWMTIDMDEYFPFLHGEPAFSKANKNQLWVMLLEKAWAKLYTSYKRIEAGYPEQALHDLTGAPIKQIYMRQQGFNKEKQWQYLLMASQREYSMVASSQPGSDTNKSMSGIVLGHAYTFLNATVIHFQGKEERIVQLRNPWGKGESKGRWNDNDPNWNYISQAEKDKIGFHKDADDGIFYMTWDEFCSQFRALTVAEINDNASYIYKSAKDQGLKGVYFKIQVVQAGFYSLQVDKTPERSFPDSEQNQYNYPAAHLQIGKLSGGGCQKLEPFSSSRRTLFKGYNLQPGEYVVKVKIDYSSRFEKDYDVNLAIYAEYACDIEFATKQEAAALTGNPNVDWTPPKSNASGPWNNMGNTNYHQGDSGWGTNNDGWGGNNDDGWGNNNKKKNDDGWGGGNDGWGGQGGGNNNPKKDDGWGNNNGWGGNQKKDDGWGNNDGWGGQGGGHQQKNDGWGHQGHQGGNNNNGWGQPGNNNSNNGWGQQPPQNNSNNGWGNQNNKGNNNSNNGWGPGW